MAIAVSLTADGIGAVYTSSGVLTGQDLLDADSRLHEELKRNPEIRYLLVDHSAISEEKIDTDSLRLLARRSGDQLELITEGLVAVVAPNDVMFGLSRMWALMADQPELDTHIARSRDEATAWLEQELGLRNLPFRLTE